MKETKTSSQCFEIREGSLHFEGTVIQWEKGQWTFEHPQLGHITKDTYSIWNPDNWEEIASRLVKGEMCAMFVAGNFGVGKILESPDWQKKGQDEGFELFERIKTRPRHLNMVAFVPPEDQKVLIDFDRLHPQFKHLRWTHNRLSAYSWAQHNIYPARNNGLIDPALLRTEDNSVACFWIPGHFGFEGITNEVRKLRKHGIFAGGSLNPHEGEPSYTPEELYINMSINTEWLEDLDFVIFDELLQKAGIGRSQTMISFMDEKAKVIRIGSRSTKKIEEETGIELGKYDTASVKKASSRTAYDEENNRIIDFRIDSARTQITRLKRMFEKGEFLKSA